VKLRAMFIYVTAKRREKKKDEKKRNKEKKKKEKELDNNRIRRFFASMKARKTWFTKVALTPEMVVLGPTRYGFHEAVCYPPISRHNPRA
jgi:hypothetical protein